MPDRPGKPIQPVATVAPGGGSEPSSSVAGGGADLAFGLYEQLRPEPGNVVFSPYGIQEALTMAYVGARGETEREMAAVLGFGVAQSDVPAAAAGLRTAIGGGKALMCANAAWVDAGAALLPDYVRVLSSSFEAGLQTVDFTDKPAAANAINRWTADKTKGKIQQVIASGEMPEHLLLALTNAVYFHQDWLSKFSERATDTGPFTLLSGNRTDVMMMHKLAEMQYAEGPGWQAVLLPYKGRGFSMLIMLPAQDKLREFESSLDRARLAEVLNAMAPETVALTLPRWRSRFRAGLPPALRVLGVRAAFEPTADFSGIASTDTLYIALVNHAATIEVDENGTEAAAATAILMPGCRAREAQSPWKVLTADRPFIYAIRHNETGAIVFLGRVADPQERGLAKGATPSVESGP